jgi:two-component system, OmpR family, sensor kinase
MASGGGSRGPFWSVRTRIVASILVTAAVGLGVAGIVSYQLQRAATMQDIDARLKGQLTEARRVIDADDGFDSVGQAVQRILSVAVPPDDGGTVGILDGKPEFTAGVMESVRLDLIPGFAKQASDDVADGTVRMGTFESDGRSYRYLATPVTLSGSKDRGAFAVAIDVGARLAPLDATYRVYTIIALISWVVIGVAGWLIAGRLLRPLRRLSTTAERISADALDERIPVQGTDDLSVMTGTVNSMLDRVRDGVTQQRELLDDVRHELKTPLSVVRGELELLDSSDPAEVAEARRVGIEEIDRMTALLDALTDLTEARTAVMEREPVDVAALTDDVLTRVSALPGRRWSLASSATGEAAIDRPRIIQAWLQLAANADTHSPEGGDIEIGSVGEGDRVRLFVRDGGEPIPADQRDRIFQRFVRGPETERTGGAGLGLSIVAAIAEAHGGSVALDSRGGGNRFSLLLPRTAPQEEPEP